MLWGAKTPSVPWYPASFAISRSVYGISFSDYCTGNNSADFVVGSLNGTESISGKQLGISGKCPDFRRKWEDRAGQRADIWMEPTDRRESLDYKYSLERNVCQDMDTGRRTLRKSNGSCPSGKENIYGRDWSGPLHSWTESAFLAPRRDWQEQNCGMVLWFIYGYVWFYVAKSVFGWTRYHYDQDSMRVPVKMQKISVCQIPESRSTRQETA